jgi:exosortase
MSAEATKQQAPQQLDLSFLRGAWPLVLGFVVLAIPTIMTLADQTWSKESGAHGPIILAAGAWLLWRQAPEFKRLASPGSLWLTALVLALGLVSYAVGRAYDFITLEAGGCYAVGLAMAHDKLGLPLMLKNWFPFLYLGFSVPPPTYVLDHLTAPLKLFVSTVATDGLHAAGLPVGREGVTITIAQYQLLVEDACSGMNSLVGLTAISLMYIYLMHGSSWRYSALLICFVIPIAIIANVIRIVILVLITYFFGDQAAQGFLHFAAGIVLFSTALLMVFLVDKLLAFARPNLRRVA